MSKAPEFSAKELEILKTQYPTIGARCHLQMDNRSRKSVQNKAQHLGIKYVTTRCPVGDRFIEAAKGPRGFSNAEMMVDGMTYKAVCTRASQLVLEGKLFTSPKRGSQIKRYFDTQERCDKFYETYIPPNQARKPKPGLLQCVPGSLARKPPAGGPARIEGELIITSQTKFTYGRKPEQTLKSNTHSLWG